MIAKSELKSVEVKSYASNVINDPKKDVSQSRSKISENNNDINEKKEKM